MALYRLLQRGPFVAPALVSALEGWVDAAGCGTMAAEHVGRGGETVAVFDLDELLDYRARRPVLDIVRGRMTTLSWPELVLRRVRQGRRDILVLSGPEPDYRWGEFRRGIVELALQLAVVESVCLGSIPSTVPHTRATPVLMTGSVREPQDTDPPLPAEHLRVPTAALNLIEVSLADHGIPSVGFWAQIPHYVAGPYAAGALALVQRVASHLGVLLPVEDLAEQARQERRRLDEIVASRPEARLYVERLEGMGAQEAAATPSDADIAAEVERFLRETTGETRNPFEEP